MRFFIHLLVLGSLFLIFVPLPIFAAACYSAGGQPVPCSSPSAVVTDNPDTTFPNDDQPDTQFPPPGGERPTLVQKFENPLAFENITEFLKAFLDVVLMILTPLIVLAIIYTGFLFVSAQGKPEALSKAKNAFFWTLVGALIVLSVYALVELIQGTVDQITK